MKVFTKGILESVNTMARAMGYNRVTQPEFLAALPDDRFYLPKFELLHEHKAGQRCDPHMRCVFDHDGDCFIIDVEMGCYNLVPDADTVLNMIREKPQKEPATAE